MKLFKIWIIGFLSVYFIPAGIGAFVYLDWSNFDFTTWQAQARVMMTFMEIGWTVLFISIMSNGVFDK